MRIEQIAEQRRGLRGRGGGVGNDVEHHAKLIGAAELGDRGERRRPICVGNLSILLSIRLPILERRDDPRHGSRRFGRCHREDHPAEAAVVGERAVEHGGQPGVFCFPGRQPDGVVEGVVPLMIDRMQRELRSPPAAERGQRTHSFQSHERRRIIHRRGK